MPVIIIQSPPPPTASGKKYPLQIATDGTMVAEAVDTKLLLLMATDGYLLDD